ncbi:hypothetical protein K435DRAFT_849887 [Dendrothele bispora CBS 962.96]|uniref:Uncharacterized protein n=1 Tax=Dendrothele bispora (strain CBS 962.96) TaxID=1314807 RepID=A0A4S8MRB8_DENBC|nr:hypothetical protein K435DRAFT_849887 [Dendrothele bispora CBS 962.96]
MPSSSCMYPMCTSSSPSSTSFVFAMRIPSGTSSLTITSNIGSFKTFRPVSSTYDVEGSVPPFLGRTVRRAVSQKRAYLSFRLSSCKLLSRNFTLFCWCALHTYIARLLNGDCSYCYVSGLIVSCSRAEISSSITIGGTPISSVNSDVLDIASKASANIFCFCIEERWRP